MTCYSHKRANVTSEDSLFRMNKGVPKLLQIFGIHKDFFSFWSTSSPIGGPLSSELQNPLQI